MSKAEAIAETAITVIDTVSEISESFTDNYVEGNFYELLDEITFLNEESVALNSLGDITDGTAIYGRAVLNLSFLIISGVIIFYGFKSLTEYFLSKKIETPWKMFIRMVIFGVLAQSSFFICYTGVYFTDGITEYINSFTGRDISFSLLEEKMSDSNLELEFNEENINIFDLEELFKISAYFLMFAMAIMLGIRFCIIRILIILSPVFFIFGGSRNTEKIFFFWGKLFLLMLTVQIVISVFLGSFSVINFQEEIISRVLLISFSVIIIKIIKIFTKKTINEWQF